MLLGVKTGDCDSERGIRRTVFEEVAVKSSSLLLSSTLDTLRVHGLDDDIGESSSSITSTGAVIGGF